MAYSKILATTPSLGLVAGSASQMGFDWVYIDAINLDTNQNPSGIYTIHENAQGQWDQLKDILNYCGRTDITSASLAQTWFQAQTPVNFINTIRKYLVEKFFPGLVEFINSLVQSGTVTPPPSGNFTTVIQGFNYILANMTVTYGSDGKVASISI